MATYSDIAAWVKERYGWTPNTGWIAHCKELNGLLVRSGARGGNSERLVRCPPSKRAAIEEAFRQFRMLNY